MGPANIHAKEAAQAKDIPSVVWPLKVITADNIKSGRCQAVRHQGGRCEAMSEAALVPAEKRLQTLPWSGGA